MNKKSKVQEEAIQAWVDNDYLGTVCLFTGGGKTKIGVDAINHITNISETPKTLIVVPTTNLKENEWPTEIDKWANKSVDKSKITIEVINTACKSEEEYDLIIIDEIHTSFSPEFGKVHNIPAKCKLGLTATAPKHNKEYMDKLEELCPTIYEVTLKQGIKMGIASPFQMYNIPVGFTRSERGTYRMWDSMFKKAQSKLWYYIKDAKKLGLNIPSENVFDCAKEWQKDKTHICHEEAKSFWTGMTMRKWVCFKASKKIDTCVEILKKYPNKKWIIFSKSTDFVDALTDAINDLNHPDLLALNYHSKLSTKDREDNLSKFVKGNPYNVLVSAEALNQGFNLPEVDAAICASGTSVSLTLIQQLGRIVRIKEDKQALFINLFVEDTQERKWVESKTKDFKNTKELLTINQLS